jgi:triacylglycerol lipase
MLTPKLRNPIVLVHGLLGYDRLNLCGVTFARYFPSIPEMLEQAGNQVLVARVHPTRSVTARAAQLKDWLESRLPAQAVHIIAHSMGGLDARYMISRLGMAERVLTLTTIGTPHRGTIFADWGIRRLERAFRPIMSFFDLPHDAFYDLTTSSCRVFNENVPDVAGVRYFSVAGRCEAGMLSPQWLVPYRIVHEAEGPNDGVVSVASASYGESTQIWEADHLSLVNWPSSWLRTVAPPCDRLPDYQALVARLAHEGY